MDEKDFEGTLVLEKMVSVGKIDEFFDAIDSDDLFKAEQLMKGAKIDADTIEIVLKKMTEADGEH